ncbi:hypothetical protein [Kocuria carniphila]|uniref:hypothetical protein n=1 Tax=Kocuria carniphila TaxID=262208 RepID=UPI0034CE2F05
MSGYKYRDPVRAGQPVFTQTDKRLHDLEQENARLQGRAKKFEALANQWANERRAAQARVKKLESEIDRLKGEVAERSNALREIEKTNESVEFYKKRVLKLGSERVQAVKKVAGRVDVNHGRVLNLLATLRSERQVLAGERSRRQHAEQALSRSEQRTDKVRTKLDRERTTHRQTVVGLQETVAGLEETIGELRARLAQRHDVVTENHVAQLEGALADQQQITADRTRERDMARGEAIGAYSLLDETHTLLTRGQLQVFEAKRLARVWGIDFEHPESEVA